MSKIRLVDAKAWKEKSSEDDLGLVKTWLPDIVRASETEAKASGAKNAERVLSFTISTDEVDRDSDTVSVSGWKTQNYKKNPVVLWAHDYTAPPIARAISVSKDDGKLVALAEFAPADLSPFADMIFRMFTGGYLRATSVGFIPLEWSESKSPDRPFGYDFTRQELLEFSAVPIPSCPSALINAHKAGVNTAPLKAWAEKVLDLKQPLHGLTRTEVEAAWEIVGSKAIIIDLKADEPTVPDSVPDPVHALEPDPETPTIEEPALPIAASIAACPECAEPVTLALPVDGGELHHRCACGAGWKIASIDLIDVSDYHDDVIELAESDESTADFDDAELVAAVERMGAALREKLSL